MALRLPLLLGLALAGLALHLTAPDAALGTHRVTVTGTSFVQPSGEVVVSVRSSARRVRVAFRTTTGRLRTRTVRTRAGLGRVTLPPGSAGIVARALGTRAKVRMRPNPLVQDANADGIADFQYDMNTDGRYELALFDDTRNGRFEWLFYDTGTALGIFRDANEDGFFETVGIDQDRDSRLERMFYDGDRDGYPELQALDYVGRDGIADTWIDTRTPSGNARQDRTAGNVMTQNIVALNQLRQLNPMSTGYIPYNPAPSLLR